MDKQIEEKLLELKDKFYNCEINDIEYRNSIKKVIGPCSIKILKSKMAQITFPDESIMLIDEWDGVRMKK